MKPKSVANAEFDLFDYPKGIAYDERREDSKNAKIEMDLQESVMKDAAMEMKQACPK